MLILSRKALQQIQIGEDIRLTIVRLDRNQVRIGIEAPAGIPVLRQELVGKPGGIAPAGPADKSVASRDPARREGEPR